MNELHYDDVLLLPSKAVVDSRSEVDVTQMLGSYQFKLPIVPANMKTVIDVDLAKWLADNGHFYVMHRFGISITDFINQMDGRYLSISIGVNQESYELLHSLRTSGSDFYPDFVTIDIAHGHCNKMKEMLRFLKNTFPETFVIAGNVCTVEGTKFLNHYGANAIKVGIASGHVCITKLQTGFSRPQFSAVQECAKVSKVPVIADGGVQNNGDIAKALVAGARMVMVGSLLAGFDESPGKKIVYPDGRMVKEYFGSASEDNKGRKEHVEGRKIEIPYRGSIVDKYKEIEESLRSSVSYAGGDSLSVFHTVKWVTQKTP